MRSYTDMVLAAALPKGQQSGAAPGLDFLLSQQVDESYFTGSYRWLWKAAVDSSLFDSGLDEDILRALLDEWKASADEKQQTLLLYLDLRQLEVSRDKLKVLLPQFKETIHADKFAEIIEASADILTGGRTNEDSNEDGYKGAKKFLIQRIAELETKEHRVLPSQDLQEGIPEFLQEYSKAKNTTDVGVLTGFTALDNLTNGIQRGELWIMCGFTGDGKSSFLLNTAYNACIKERKNVLYVSLEMPLHQVRRRLVVRHSNHSQFGLHGGLDYVRVKRGSLNVDDEKALHAVAVDLGSGDYGRLNILQMAKSDTVDNLRERAMYARSRGPIDLLVLDYAPLLSAARRRQNRQDEIVEVIEGLKSLALNFNEGEGLALLSAQQTSRKAKEEALEANEYGMSFAADTSAIEKNSDLLGWVLRTDELEAAHELRCGVSKYRDGESGLRFNLYERYASCLLDNMNDGAVGPLL